MRVQDLGDTLRNLGQESKRQIALGFLALVLMIAAAVLVVRALPSRTAATGPSEQELDRAKRVSGRLQREPATPDTSPRVESAPDSRPYHNRAMTEGE